MQIVWLLVGHNILNKNQKNASFSISGTYNIIIFLNCFYKILNYYNLILHRPTLKKRVAN